MSGQRRIAKHVREALERLPGWEVVGNTGKGHYRLLHRPSGARMVAASSPSDHRVRANMIREAHRLERKARAQD